jgi:hypothetical protein
MCVSVLHRKNETIELPPASYFAPGVNDNELCIQMENRGNDVCVLGMSFFKHKNVIFDLEEKRIGKNLFVTDRFLTTT